MPNTAEENPEERRREELVIDLSNVPLKPLGKSEIQQLEMALIVGTLYRPEILELIRDPAERSTWVDSLAVAAASLARSRAGMSAPQIAGELGRTEATVRNHLNQKTKAGKLVAETYEKLKKGELKIFVPFMKAPSADLEDKIKFLEQELSRYKDKARELESRVSEFSQRIQELLKEVNEKKAVIEELERKLSEANREKEKCLENNQLIIKVLNDVYEKLKIVDEVKETLKNIKQ
ncbi:MAG: transcriptional regulator [Thermoprotei archaeon]